MIRDKVLVVVPPNSNTVISGRLLTVTRPEEHSDWSDFMCLGVLSLVSALVSFDDLAQARRTIREQAKTCGVVIGE